jgi:hypothetical protein
MSMQDWLSLAGLAVPIVVAVGPWLFAVHSRLAVIGSRVEQLCGDVRRLADAHDDRLAMCIDHQSRLEALGMRVECLEGRWEEAA